MNYLEKNRGFVKLFSPSRWKLKRDQRKRELRVQIFALVLLVIILALM